MEHTYTHRAKSIVDKINNENLADDFCHDLGDEENKEKLKELLKDFDRPFSEGLTLLLKRSSYDGDFTDSTEKKDFIFKQLEYINVLDSKLQKTITNWLNGSSCPKNSDDTTRDRIYQLCFALSVSINDVNWFFNHILFQRSFNCHRIKEAIYYYCFKHNYGYEHAQQLITEIQSFPETNSQNPKMIIYTKDIQKQLNDFSTDEELKQYFRKNKWVFQGNAINQSAKKNINKLLNEIRGKKEDKEIAQKVKNRQIDYPKYDKTNPVSIELNNCGLVVQEVLSFHKYIDTDTKINNTDTYVDDADYLNFLINTNDISSISFMLKCIYGRFKAQNDITIKDIDLPSKGKRNFPSKKIFSDLLRELETSTNYDSIRKLLILLKFYEFWCKYELSDFAYSKFIKPADTAIGCYDEYINETNDLLMDCGYDELFAGNSYDALFMLCSGTAAPLETLRNFLSKPSTENSK